MLAALKASSEKLATIHTSTLTKVSFSQNLLLGRRLNTTDMWIRNFQVNDLVKDLVRYSEELHKKHKQIKVMEQLNIKFTRRSM